MLGAITAARLLHEAWQLLVDAGSPAAAVLLIDCPLPSVPAGSGTGR